MPSILWHRNKIVAVFSPGFTSVRMKVDQWKHTFIQVGGACRPIIHLNIDIIMIVHTPRSIDIIMPDTLQIRRHIARTGTGNQTDSGRIENIILPDHNPAVLPGSFSERWGVGRFTSLDRRIQVQFNPVEQSSIIIVMLTEQSSIPL